MHPQENVTAGFRKFSMYLLLIAILCSGVQSRVTKVTEYPNSDEYFDRIYVIQNGDQQHYLRVYCKEKNMVSISITKEL